MKTDKKMSKVERIMLLNAKTALNVEDVAAYTGHQTSYIYKLVSERKIPHYKREGGKFVYFKKTDIDEWMLSHRVATVDEISGQASAYVERTPIQEVFFTPSKKFVEGMADDEEDEQPKKKAKAKSTTRKASAKKSKATEEAAAKTKKGTKKAPSKKSKDEEESPKKSKKTTKKTPTKTKKTTKKK